MHSNRVIIFPCLQKRAQCTFCMQGKEMRNRDERERRVTCNRGALRAGLVAACSWGGGGWEPRWCCCSGRRWLLQGATSAAFYCLCPSPVFILFFVVYSLAMAMLSEQWWLFSFLFFFLLSFSSFLLFHSLVSLFRFFFSAAPLPLLFLFLLLLSFLTVQVLLSMTGRMVAAGGDSGGCGRRPRWRKKQREEQLLGTRTKDDFFLNLDPRSCPLEHEDKIYL